MNHRYSIKEIIDKLREVHGEEITIDPSTYTTKSAKARFIHEEYGDWWARPDKVLSGQSHPKGKYKKIAERKAIPIEQIKKRLQEVHGGKVSLKEETYTRTKDKAVFIDKDYGEWEATACSVLSGSGHPKRGRAAAREKLSTPIEDLLTYLSNDQFLSIDESTYVDGTTKAKFIDKDYGEWWTEPARVMNERTRHPKRATLLRKEAMIKRCGCACYANSKEYMEKYGNKRTSKAETEIRHFVQSLGFTTESSVISGYEYDILVSSRNIAIEHNGLYYHSETKGKGRLFHLRKTIACNRKGIRLIHIWEHWWQHRKEQVKIFITSALGKNRTVYGRKCKISEVSLTAGQDFLDRTHILGSSSRSFKAIGLLLNEELIGVATFSIHHRNNKELVLDRFACKEGITIVGGLSRISKFASSLFKKDLTSWADKSISEGNGYLKAGWIKEEVLPPDYFYYKNGKGYVSKQSRQKRLVGTPRGMTEAEHAKLDGLHRIWDVGKIRFRYPYKEA
jgi:hypothetical protein